MTRRTTFVLVLIVGLIGSCMLIAGARHHQKELVCCSAQDLPSELRPVDVLGNAQELHAASDSFSGCIAKHGQPLMIPTQTPDGRVILFYVACSVGNQG